MTMLWRVHHQGRRRLLVIVSPPSQSVQQHRAFGLLVARIAKSLVKIRYLILGGSVAGGYSVHQVSQLNIYRTPFRPLIDTT